MTQAAPLAMEEVPIIVQNVVKNIDIIFQLFKGAHVASLVSTIVMKWNSVRIAIKTVIPVPMELFKDVQVVIKIVLFLTTIVLIKIVL